jgi:MFS family permease
LVQTTGAPADTGAVHSTRYARTQVLERYGGFYWGADFIGFVVAAFFTMLFLGIVGAIVGSVGYQLGQPLPKIGHAVSQTSQNLGIGALIGSLVAIFLAYLIGGYTAGRMARFSGARNGLGVVIWTVIIAILLGIAGAALGSNFNVASQLHLKFDPQTVTAAGAISAVITLLDMILGATLGGMMGERYHRDIDRETGTLG